jgi:hypothetical protein
VMMVATKEREMKASFCGLCSVVLFFLLVRALFFPTWVGVWDPRAVAHRCWPKC